MLDQTNQPVEPQQPAPARSNRKWIALAIGGGCAILACAAVVVAVVITALVPSVRSRLNPSQLGINATSGPGDSAGSGLQQSGNTMGDSRAPVKIVEYADFQCPYCRAFALDTEPQIVDTYVQAGKVYFEYRSVGAFLGQESADAAEAAYCAGDQGKFWEYHDTLFNNWTGENVGDFTKAKLQQYAASVGLDKAAFSECLSTGKYTQRVTQDAANAQSDGVRATPSFLINGKLVEGAQPFDVFQKEIDAALQGK
jgi:protein-disulfide isomerase